MNVIEYGKAWFHSFRTRFSSSDEAQVLQPPKSSVPDLEMSALEPGWQDFYKYTVWDGDKFPGGFGPTEISYVNYYDLRLRSQQLFLKNAYAQGILRRLVTNIINQGLHLESMPNERVLGFEEEDLNDWSDDVEVQFNLWGKDKKICDEQGLMTWGELQQVILLEAIISGDILVIINIDRNTRLPQIMLVDAQYLQNPINSEYPDRKIIHGVELDDKGRHIAYHIVEPTSEFGQTKTRRITAKRTRDNRTRAFLVYGGDRRLRQVRGISLLSSVAQGLREIDRYRDAAVRKAIVNSLLAVFIKKTEDKVSSLPLQQAATVNSTITEDGATSGNYLPRTFQMSRLIPGTALEELQVGEEPVVHSTSGTDVNFNAFEEGIISGLAWQLQIPPEVLKLSFSSNYSASQQANNEFRLFLDMARVNFASQVNQIVFENFLIQATLAQYIDDKGILRAFRTPSMSIQYQAWLNSDWMGAVKPSTDPLKQTKATLLQMGKGLISPQRASRELNGSNFDKNVKQLRKANEKLAWAMEPIQDMTGTGADAEEPDEDDSDGEQTALKILNSQGEK